MVNTLFSLFSELELLYLFSELELKLKQERHANSIYEALPITRLDLLVTNLSAKKTFKIYLKHERSC